MALTAIRAERWQAAGAAWRWQHGVGEGGSAAAAAAARRQRSSGGGGSAVAAALQWRQLCGGGSTAAEAVVGDSQDEGRGGDVEPSGLAHLLYV